MERTAEQLIASVLLSDDETTASSLLNEFYNGYPVENVFRLLDSNNVHAVEVGAWISFEISTSLGGYASRLAQYLDHPSYKVRFDLVHAILNAAGEDDTDALSQVVLLLFDPDHRVRKAVTRFLIMIPTQFLSIVHNSIQNKVLKALLIWLVEIENAAFNSRMIEDKMNTDDELEILFAIVALERANENRRSLLSRVTKLDVSSDIYELAQASLGLDDSLNVISWEVIIRTYIEFLHSSVSEVVDGNHRESSVSGKLSILNSCQKKLLCLIEEYNMVSSAIPTDKLKPTSLKGRLSE